MKETLIKYIPRRKEKEETKKDKSKTGGCK
jgi:hypothetical protein